MLHYGLLGARTGDGWKGLPERARLEVKGARLVVDNCKLNYAPPIWYGVDGWSPCRISIMGRKCRCIVNYTSSLRGEFDLGRWWMGSGCQPLGNWLGRWD
jgi:hypothetical protein